MHRRSRFARRLDPAAASLSCEVVARRPLPSRRRAAAAGSRGDPKSPHRPRIDRAGDPKATSVARAYRATKLCTGVKLETAQPSSSLRPGRNPGGNRKFFSDARPIIRSRSTRRVLTPLADTRDGGHRKRRENLRKMSPQILLTANEIILTFSRSVFDDISAYCVFLPDGRLFPEICEKTRRGGPSSSSRA